MGETSPKACEARIQELVDGHPTLEAIAEALLKVRAVFVQELRSFERRVRQLARDNPGARRLMTTPGVGVVVLTYVSAIDAVERFRSSRMVGPEMSQAGTPWLTHRSRGRTCPSVASLGARRGQPLR